MSYLIFRVILLMGVVFVGTMLNSYLESYIKNNFLRIIISYGLAMIILSIITVFGQRIGFFPTAPLVDY